MISMQCNMQTSSSPCCAHAHCTSKRGPACIRVSSSLQLAALLLYTYRCVNHADVCGDKQPQEGVSLNILATVPIIAHCSQFAEATSEARAPGNSTYPTTIFLHHCNTPLLSCRNVDLLCSVKYKNNLSDIPFGPKFLSYPFDSQRYQ